MATLSYHKNHSAPKRNRTPYSVLTMAYCLGPLYRVQKSAYDTVAIDKEGWALVADGLTEAEANQMRSDLYSGELTIEDIAAGQAEPRTETAEPVGDTAPDEVYVTRHGMVIPTKEQLTRPVKPTRAEDIDGFGWSIVLGDIYIGINTSLIYAPLSSGRGKVTPRWISRNADCCGFEFDLVLYRKDIDFLGHALVIKFGNETIWRNDLPDNLCVGIDRLEGTTGIGLRCAFGAGGLLYADPARDPRLRDVPGWWFPPESNREMTCKFVHPGELQEAAGD